MLERTIQLLRTLQNDLDMYQNAGAVALREAVSVAIEECHSCQRAPAQSKEDACLADLAEQWRRQAQAVGIIHPGGMQHAKHLADAAIRALELEYDNTSPSDITHQIDSLQQRVVSLRDQLKTADADNERLSHELRSAEEKLSSAARTFAETIAALNKDPELREKDLQIVTLAKAIPEPTLKRWALQDYPISRLATALMESKRSNDGD